MLHFKGKELRIHENVLVFFKNPPLKIQMARRAITCKKASLEE